MPRAVIEYGPLGVAIVLLLLAVSIHVVMPVAVLVLVRLAAAEVTPWLVALGLLVAGLAASRPGRS